MTATTMSALIAIIIAICQAVKLTRFPARYIPVLAVALGILGSVYVSGSDWIQIAAGVLAGLAASGLYSGYKKTIINK